MNEKDLAELLKYSNSKELYIVAYNGRIKLLICPFKVVVLSDVALLNKGQIVLVNEVKVTLELITVYIIDGVAYYYYHFDIIYAG